MTREPDAGGGEAGHTDTGGAGGGGRARLFWAVAAALIVVLAVLTGLLLWQRYSDDGPGTSAGSGASTLSSPYIDTAEKVVLAVTNVNADTVEANAQTVLDNSTGDFKDTYAGAQGQFAALVGEADATSTGTIVQSGLESVDPDGNGSVLLVVSTEVRNKAVEQPSKRGFRLRVTVQKDAGSYKVSDLEQVP